MLKPNTDADLAELLATRTDPLRVIGGGTRPIGSPEDGDVLSTRAIDGIKLYEPEALTLVAKAGTPIKTITDTLAKEGQKLAFEPMDHRPLMETKGDPTIGGVVAANVSGPRRVAVGAARDFLLGVTFVNGVGEIIKNGGRVMKNVTGYDLVKLMSGSYGTLGVLTEVALKVLPDDEAAQTVQLAANSASQAVDIMSSALGSPFDVRGAAYDPHTGYVSLRLEGFSKSVAYRSDALARHLKQFGTANTVDGAAHEKLWVSVRDVTSLAAGNNDIWRISVRPSSGSEVIKRLNTQSYQMDWGGGLIWVATEAGTNIRSSLEGINGHATLVRANTETKTNIPTFHPEHPHLAAIADGLRKKFDPHGILNPGLMN